MRVVTLIFASVVLGLPLAAQSIDNEKNSDVVKIPQTQSTLSIGASDPDDIYWDVSLSLPAEPGAQINALTVYDGKLIAGGNFAINSPFFGQNIAAWDGSNWSQLGSGFDGAVYALTVYDNKLIAGGVFPGQIAWWNGADWLPLGSKARGDNGALGYVSDFTIFNNKLVAGGLFYPTGATAYKLAAWNGSSWYTGFPYVVLEDLYALTAWDDELVISSWAYSTPDQLNTHSYISFFNESQNLGGVAGEVNYDYFVGLTVYKNKLIVGGSFSGIGNAPSAHDIASFDGLTWSAMGYAGYFPHVFTNYDGKLVAGVSSNNNDINGLSYWNGTSWLPLGSGTFYVNSPFGGGGVLALTVFNTKLIVSGNLIIAGGKATTAIAQWTKRLFLCGDLNDDGAASTILDLNFLVNDIFRGGPSASVPESADLNGDGSPATILDLNFMVNDIFRGGPSPTCGL